ncbi:unnamed protein product [Lymnaea stagnalis]|uniref:Uncharacterized protein n=1 Tax=Lymnaea stagnalis TaxID=6523 RepID=A0AAV2HUI2_LYMST
MGYTISPKDQPPKSERDPVQYCISYTGQGGIKILHKSLRRRIIQLIDTIGAWIVSEYQDRDVLESTKQPFVLPNKLETHNRSYEKSLWPPSFTYSSVALLNKIKPKKDAAAVGHIPYECVLVTQGDANTLQKLLDMAENPNVNVLILKGFGGLADALVNQVSSKQKGLAVSIKEILIQLNEYVRWEQGEKENAENGHDSISMEKRLSLIPPSIPPNEVQENKNSTAKTPRKDDTQNLRLEKLCDIAIVFEPDQSLPDLGLGKAILQTILKGNPKKNSKLLKLCIDLDCFEEAEKYLLKDLKIMDCLSVIQSAYSQKRLQFVEYFLRKDFFLKLQSYDIVMYSIVTDSRALNFCNSTLWQPDLLNESPDDYGIYDHLFRHCLVSQNIAMSMLFWLDTKNPLGTLLLAYHYLKKAAKRERNHLKRANLKEAALEYQAIGVSYVNACYDEDPETTIKMITRKMKQIKDNPSCIDLALLSHNLDFLIQPACITLQRRVWRWGNLWDFYSENGQKTTSLNLTENWKRYFLLLCVPMTMFSLNGIGLLIFLFIYCLVVLGRLTQHTFHWMEGYLVLYVMVGFMQESYELKNKGLKSYLKSGWNLVDIISILLFVIAAGLRIYGYFDESGTTMFDFGRVALCLDFIIFTLRLLHNCYGSPTLGPTCAMIIKTIKLLSQFLYILAVIWVSYAVATEAILYPNTVLNRFTIYYIFRKAYWQMFGELFLDEMEAGKADDPNSLVCTNDATKYATYEMLRCPSTIGRYFAPVLLAVYIMFTYVLLFSLITAAFTKSIAKIQKKSRKLWRFQFCELTRDFSKIMFLPLPFTLISLLARVFDQDLDKEDGFSIYSEHFQLELKESNESGKITREIIEKIEDLETFVRQNDIEPLIEKKRQKLESKESRSKIGTAESDPENNKTAHKVNQDEGRKTERRPSNFFRKDSGENKKEFQNDDEDSEPNPFLFWVPMYSDSYLVSKEEQSQRMVNEPINPKGIKFNTKDKKHNVNRRSYLGTYAVENSGPINPKLLNDFKSQKEKDAVHKMLPRWGPNHVGIAIVTRVQVDGTKIVKKDGKVVLEFLMNVENDGNYSFPTVFCSPECDLFTEYISGIQIKFEKTQKILQKALDGFKTEKQLQDVNHTVTLRPKEGRSPIPHQNNNSHTGPRLKETATIGQKDIASPIPYETNSGKSDTHEKQESKNRYWEVVRKQYFSSQSKNSSWRLVRTTETRKKRNKIKMKSKSEIELRHCQKINTIFIGQLEDPYLMTKHKWIEIRIVNYHNPNIQHQEMIEKNTNLKWINYEEGKAREKIMDLDIFGMVCKLHNAYISLDHPRPVSRKPTSWALSSRPMTTKPNPVKRTPSRLADNKQPNFRKSSQTVLNSNLRGRRN